MDEFQNPRTHCKRCGAEIAMSDAVCGLCGEPRSPSKPTLDIDEPWLAAPPTPVNNPYQAPQSLPEPPGSAWRVLLRIFLLLCGIGVVALSMLIAFFAACLAAGAGSNNFGIAMLGGTVAAGVVLVVGARVMNKWFRKKPKTGIDR